MLAIWYRVSEMKSVSSLEISFGAEPFYAETLILMNLNIGTFGFCIFIQKLLEIFLVLFSFCIDLTVFSFGIGFRHKPNKEYLMLLGTSPHIPIRIGGPVMLLCYTRSLLIRKWPIFLSS